MAYDSHRDRIILFGGDVFANLGDTWEFDGQTWNQIDTADSPSARKGHVLIYDSLRRRVVLFGGRDDNGLRSDTWEHDGQNWALSAASGPPARERAGMAFDSDRGVAVLFGGGPSRLDDTWEFDGSSWQPIATAGPSGRLEHGMAYDSRRGLIVMYGGDTAGPADGTWEYDGQTWTQHPAASPPYRRSPTLAYDHTRGQVLMFGGIGGGSPPRRSDTWTFDGTVWRQITIPNETMPRAGVITAHDPVRGRTVLYNNSETWEWDGQNWAVVSTPGPIPASTNGHQMVFDPGRQQIVLFGGNVGQTPLGATWVYDGTWTDISEPTRPPPQQFGHSMAYDLGRGRIVLNTGDATWELDSVGWSQVTGALPPADGVMVYDQNLGRVLLLINGGDVSTPLEAWTFDGQSWTALVTNGGPQLAINPRLVFEDVRQKPVLVIGGVRTNGIPFETWELDGQDWRDITPALTPLQRFAYGVSYDPAEERVVLVGGDDFGPIVETWTLAPPSTPLFQLAAQVPTDIPSERFLDVRVRAFCGGVYAPFGAGDTGAQLLGWVTDSPTGGWEILRTHSAGVPIPTTTPDAALLDYQTPANAGPKAARRFLFGPERRMYFQCRPSGKGGRNDAQVALDYFEVRLRYSTL